MSLEIAAGGDWTGWPYLDRAPLTQGYGPGKRWRRWDPRCGRKRCERLRARWFSLGEAPRVACGGGFGCQKPK